MRGKTGRGAGRGWASLRDGVGDGDDDYDGVGDDEHASGITVGTVLSWMMEPISETPWSQAPTW